ncbi:hypothetical protein [Solimonas sp. SE-A11]|uniref:hypothetical protein n=1 Tax=Solimonas sp. SE-A11 TaxID=3054954 RepID=UPI00259CBF53|nr:hypothetical protein [Solimonas sp. SE-A11]MDM4770497.1 hypothetical protein [Solimonas sp. SE-A11]
MQALEVPDPFRARLGPEMKMDVHWVDVKLKSGAVHRGLVVRGSRYLTGTRLNPEGGVPFEVEDIIDLRRQSVWPW